MKTLFFFLLSLNVHAASVTITLPSGSGNAALIQGVPVSSTAPTANQVLLYNSTTTQWEPQPVSISALTALHGDVTASGPGNSSSTVQGLQGLGIASTSPTNTQVLTWNSTLAQWNPQAASGGITALTGDVSASGSGSVSSTVKGLQGLGVATTSPTSAQVLTWNATTGKWDPENASSGGSNWQISANVTGGAAGFSTTTVASLSAPTATSLTLNPLTGSAAAGQTCSGTNHAANASTSATNCGSTGGQGGTSAGTLGITFTAPSAGNYEVCFSAGAYYQGASGAVIQPVYELIETPINAETFTYESGNEPGAVADIPFNTGHVGIFFETCAIFPWTGISANTSKTVRIFYLQTISSAAVSSGAFLCDQGVGARTCYWSVKKLGGA